MSQIADIPVPAQPGLFTAPRLTRTVPREFVHRAAVAEVLLTDWRPLGPASFALSAQWPRGHRFYTPIAGRWHDPLLAAETIRQAGLLVSHAEFGVPMDHRFVMSELSCTGDPAALAAGYRPPELDLLLVCDDIRRRGGALAGMSYDVVLLRDGSVAAQGRAQFTCVSPAAYRRLRGERRADGPDRAAAPSRLPAEDPALVGRTSVHDVVVTPSTGGTRRLRFDLDHPTMFDHPADHVPGMVVVEAARQAALAELHPLRVLPIGFDARFLRWTEFDEPCVIDAAVGPAGNGDLIVRLTFRQAGATVFECAVTATPID